MKLDLTSIQKLSPAGLWDLAELSAVISTLMAVIAGGFGGGACVRRCQRMVKNYQRLLQGRKQDNFNMRVKAWVLQCPERTAHVRGVIGEAAIKRWNKNRFLDYAFTKEYGDWKTVFSGGVLQKDKTHRPRTQHNPTSETRVYRHKPFALVKIPNAVRILYGQTRLLALSDMTKENAQMRTVHPVRFRPDELGADAATSVTQEGLEVAEETRLASRVPEIFLLPKADDKIKEPPQEKIDTKPP